MTEAIHSTQQFAHKTRMEYSGMLGLSNSSLMPETNAPASEAINYWKSSNEILSHEVTEKDISTSSKSSGRERTKSHDSDEKPGSHRRGPFRDEHHRAETAQTRKLTACLRCRMQRVRVGLQYILLQTVDFSMLIACTVCPRSHRPSRYLYDLQGRLFHKIF